MVIIHLDIFIVAGRGLRFLGFAGLIRHWTIISSQTPYSTS
jgi:hypothetical protein